MFTVSPQIAVYGVGSDIVFIPRIERLWQRFGQRFSRKILTAKERELMPDNPQRIVSYIAKRFAAKEAVSKALGTGLGANFHFHDVEILKNLLGQPYALLNPQVEKNLGQILKIHLTLSDEKDYALAFCLIEKQGSN